MKKSKSKIRKNNISKSSVITAVIASQAKGQNPLDEHLFKVVNKILSDLRGAEKMAVERAENVESAYPDGQKAKRNLSSLKWNVSEALVILSRSNNPQSWCHDLIAGAYIEHVDKLRHQFYRVWMEVEDVLGQAHRHVLCNRLASLYEEVYEAEEKLNMMVGFVLGLRIYREQLADGLKQIGLDCMGKMQVAHPLEVGGTDEQPAPDGAKAA